MSEPVTDLERMGYPERVPDPTDGRVRLVRLTEEGRALQRIAMAEIAQIEDAWVRRLGAAGRCLRQGSEPPHSEMIRPRSPTVRALQ